MHSASSFITQWENERRLESLPRERWSPVSRVPSKPDAPTLSSLLRDDDIDSSARTDVQEPTKTAAAPAGSMRSWSLTLRVGGLTMTMDFDPLVAEPRGLRVERGPNLKDLKPPSRLQC
jgi:hypothetical protein